ncbi:MAG: DUF2306 domain-containing protein [Betaproteobacteria bacterium]|nr:DUF2306 domain-containing protein [Betaproteobacteria bacterium]
MTYLELAYLHLATVVPAFLIGTWMMINRKGTPLHKRLGKIYLVLMGVTGVVTLFMPAVVGPRLLGHFGFIHLFSVLALYTVPTSWRAARRGDVRQHRASMIGLYIGGMLIAGTLAFGPGRLLNEWAFG